MNADRASKEEILQHQADRRIKAALDDQLEKDKALVCMVVVCFLGLMFGVILAVGVTQ